MIDKNSESWKSESPLIKFVFWGVKARSQVIMIEYISLILGVISWLLKPDVFATPAFFLMAYIFSTMKYYIDRKRHW